MSESRAVAYMKIFWCVAKDVFSNGKPRTRMFAREYEQKPKDSFSSSQEKDTSRYWFDAKEEAKSLFDQLSKVTKKTEQPAQPQKILWNVKETAASIGFSPEWIYKRRKEGTLPFPCVPVSYRKLLFDPAAVVAWKDIMGISTGVAPGNIKRRRL
jgi:predicted DNA-binding transcriptional regulator AlpA